MDPTSFWQWHDYYRKYGEEYGTLPGPLYRLIEIWGPNLTPLEKAIIECERRGV